MKKRLSILGSTGSVGTQALELCRQWHLRPVALAAHRNVALMERQAREFRPQLVAMSDTQAAAELRVKLADTDIIVADDATEAVIVDCDIVLNAVVGVAGLPLTMAAIHTGHDVALANKESLVAGGQFVMQAAQRAGVQIIPMDSEHSAIFQVLAGQDVADVQSVILTASGGPFFGMDRGQLRDVTKNDALAHPTWRMGGKITIDSATLMNKGLELIEAMHLFGLQPAQVDAVIHRQSIIHSMVQFRDGATLMQAGLPDMRLPIAYALTHPQRWENGVEMVDWRAQSPLTFAVPDEETFGCLRLAKQAMCADQATCVVLNAANECAVEAFLQDKIGFLDIEAIVAEQLGQLYGQVNNIEDCLALDVEIRKKLM
ncbi:MAG: 1-deoxy-D-xylulose-5-phosphate reductoisomerase [Oscillospiraceae bacterium]|nr:1-deoxy-D-xylulose-5-phosphate reductoisomerase [Oscillospiraceae bacterium]